MVVLILEKAAVGLRGEITRWMIEPRPGVFVGKMSAMVRDKLWEHICEKHVKGGAVMVYSKTTEQGFAVKVNREPSRRILDREGIFLVTVPRKGGEWGDDD